ncbi:MAG: hypothetical protein E5299_01152 [Burkholderia gladioli]|nr:MAG: hypothetical protein E5299_01152 [Burkholderia gladioli]
MAKVNGRCRQHGSSKRRTWRKVHLALNANTRVIEREDAIASTGIISSDTNGFRTSEVRNPFHCVLTLDLCNNAGQARCAISRSAEAERADYRQFEGFAKAA